MKTMVLTFAFTLISIFFIIGYFICSSVNHHDSMFMYNNSVLFALLAIAWNNAELPS